MKILVTNDDGVYAPGIITLARTLQTVAEVIVMAPDRNQSATSHALTLHHPIRVKKVENDFYSVEGTPTDCVHLALRGFFETLPDMVVSGINKGANMGDDVFYSGTVSAAAQARYLGIPAIAVSLAGANCTHYQTAANVIRDLLPRLEKDPLTNSPVLNVNVPDVPENEIRGIKIARLGKRHRAEQMISTTDPRGNPVWWVGPLGNELLDAGPGTDFHAIAEHYVSITPLKLDLTDNALIDTISTWINKPSEKT